MALLKRIVARFKSGARKFFLPCEENNYRARIFTGKTLFVFFVAAVTLKAGFALFLYSFPNNQFYADITKTSLVELANVERAKHNLAALTENSDLNNAAYMKALDMEKNGYFNHFSPSGVSPWHWFGQAGYNYKYAGENLAIGFLESNEVQDAWTASPTHKANIINNKYKEIGIAVLKANFQGNPATIVVQLFGTKQANVLAGKNTQTNAAATAASANSGEIDGQNNSQTKQTGVLGIASETRPDRNSAEFKAVLFFAEKYFSILQALIYGLLIFVIVLLLLNFALKADIDHTDLLLKAFGFIAVMGIFALLDQSLIAALIPHNLLIQ
ncbi:MAG: CAP domain-containing protein [Candidatus Nealsonbacteria bacterium DGGOD1a]|jgi:hypothetical protein|nr:MAG: CAP domain-containing protein [Candidatus Nealsonbacteria bacterium DGGOD1a]